MKRWITALALLGLLTGCITTESGRKKEAVIAGSPGWTIKLKGVRTTEVTSGFYNDAKQHPSHYSEIRLPREGTEQVYKAMPLYLVIAMADGEDSGHPYTFDRPLWERGYDITVTARDGYTVTFNTRDILWQALHLSDTRDGVPVAPSLVGDVPGHLWVTDVVEIELGLIQNPPVVTGGDFTLELEVNGTEHAFSLSALKASPFYREDKGSFTTSAGTRYSNIYGGIPIGRFLGQYLELEPETSVRILAMDGYEMVYKASLLLDESAGTWILAFVIDGAPLPYDPGYIRTVKIGPDDPNIEGHLSVKMIRKVVVEGKAYRDFDLTISGKLTSTLDRSTIQSGVNCHAREVNYERKDTRARYTGIPLWRLLAYADDAQYAPHKQDKAIISYDRAQAQAGYKIEIIAADGFTITLDSREIDGNEDVILALYRDGEELPEGEWPLILVWDREAAVVPAGIKPVKMITRINLVF